MFDRLKAKFNGIESQTKVAYENRDRLFKTKVPKKLQKRADEGDATAKAKLDNSSKKYKTPNGVHLANIASTNARSSKKTLAAAQLKKATGLSTSWIRDVMDLVDAKNFPKLNRAVPDKNRFDFDTADLMRLRDALRDTGAAGLADIIQYALNAKDSVNAPDGPRFDADNKVMLSPSYGDNRGASEQRAPARGGALAGAFRDAGEMVEAGLRKTKATVVDVPTRHAVREADKMARNTRKVSVGVAKDVGQVSVAAAEYGWEQAGEAAQFGAKVLKDGYKATAAAVKATSEAAARGAHNTRVKATEVPGVRLGAKQSERYAERNNRINSVINTVTYDVAQAYIGTMQARQSNSASPESSRARNILVPHMHQDEVRAELARLIAPSLEQQRKYEPLPGDRLDATGRPKPLTDSQVKYLARAAKDITLYPIMINDGDKTRNATSFAEAVQFAAQTIATEQMTKMSVINAFETKLRSRSSIASQGDSDNESNKSQGSIGVVGSKARALWKTATAAVTVKREGAKLLKKTFDAPPYAKQLKDWADPTLHERAVKRLASALRKRTDDGNGNVVSRIATAAGPFRDESGAAWAGRQEGVLRGGNEPAQMAEEPSVLRQAMLFKRLTGGAISTQDFTLSGDPKTDAITMAARWRDFSSTQKAVVRVAHSLLMEDKDAPKTSQMDAAALAKSAKNMFPLADELRKEIRRVFLQRLVLEAQNTPRDAPAYAKLDQRESAAYAEQAVRIERFLTAYEDSRPLRQPGV